MRTRTLTHAHAHARTHVQHAHARTHMHMHMQRGWLAHPHASTAQRSSAPSVGSRTSSRAPSRAHTVRAPCVQPPRVVGFFPSNETAGYAVFKSMTRKLQGMISFGEVRGAAQASPQPGVAAPTKGAAAACWWVQRRA
jgi:hypothetical protein